MMRRRIIMVCLVMALSASTALGESAWIHTGRGDLNMRRSASSKADIVKKIPDKAQVELLETDGDWSYIDYKGKKGYVKTEFLSMSAPAEDSGTAPDAAQDTAQEADEALLQRGGFAWIRTTGGKLNMRRKADAKSAVVTEIPNGERVAVSGAGQVWSSVSYRGKNGYVKTEYLLLDAQLIGRAVYPDENYIYIREEEDEAAKTVVSIHPSQRMTILEMSEDWAKVSCEDPVLGEQQGYISLEEIAMLRETPADRAMPQINANMILSAGSLAVGEVLDISLSASSGTQCLLYLTRDGETVIDGKPVTYSAFSYRPRESGAYRMEVIASAADGNSIGCQAEFIVGLGEAQTEGSFVLHSQKDGWWLDKKYGRSNMDQSGCAIFTLSHALRLLGHAEEEASPQALAAAYPMYLTESGTVTENLIQAAARDFGFSGGKEKIKNTDKIIQQFEQGAVFSFSVADGHIALAAGMSDDGTKVRIIDSAPSATFERIENANLYYLDEQGAFRAANSLMDIPGARYYVETGEFGGLEYYLDLDYVAKRGVRMIRPKSE